MGRPDDYEPLRWPFVGGMESAQLAGWPDDAHPPWGVGVPPVA